MQSNPHQLTHARTQHRTRAHTTRPPAHNRYKHETASAVAAAAEPSSVTPVWRRCERHRGTCVFKSQKRRPNRSHLRQWTPQRRRPRDPKCTGTVHTGTSDSDNTRCVKRTQPRWGVQRVVAGRSPAPPCVTTRRVLRRRTLPSESAPLSVYASVWHTPVYSTRTRTSPLPQQP